MKPNTLSSSEVIVL